MKAILPFSTRNSIEQVAIPPLAESAIFGESMQIKGSEVLLKPLFAAVTTDRWVTNRSRDAQASGWKRTATCHGFRSSTREFALLG